MSRIAVIGAGITGLTHAYRLLKEGAEVTVFEASSAPGGAMKSFRSGEWLSEDGPNSIQDTSPALGKLVEELGLTSSLLEASTESRRRYIVRNQKPVLVPTGPLTAVTTPLFSFGAKMGIFAEPFRPTPNFTEEFDESLADFVRRRLGSEFLDYAINPMVGGIYAGNPELLSVVHAFPRIHKLEKDFGSLIKGAIGRKKQLKASGESPHKKRILSFRNGLGDLVSALSAALGNRLMLSAKVSELHKLEDNSYRLQFTQNGKSSEADFTQIVFAGTIPSLQAIRFENVSGMPDPFLETLNYAPVCSVSLGFRREDIHHPLDGFGVLVPEVEKMQILGCLFPSSIFPGRAPEGHELLTVFVGGMRQPQLTHFDDDELTDLVLSDLDRLLGISGEPVFRRIVRWPKAIPQYEVGFSVFLERFAAIELANPGLRFEGNYRTGISVDSCIQRGLNPQSRV